MKQLEQYAVCRTQLLTFLLLAYGLLPKNFHRGPLNKQKP